jgi:hypothetical protein
MLRPCEVVLLTYNFMPLKKYEMFGAVFFLWRVNSPHHFGN